MELEEFIEELCVVLNRGIAVAKTFDNLQSRLGMKDEYYKGAELALNTVFDYIDAILKNNNVNIEV